MLQSSGLAAPFWTEHDIHFRIGGEQFVGTVVAAISDPHDAELVFGVVECQRVFHLLCHDIFLIVGTYHEGHRREFVVSR